MDREQRRVVALDPRQERDGDRRQPAEERCGPPPRHRPTGWSRRTRRRAQPPRGRQQQRIATSGSKFQPSSQGRERRRLGGTGPCAAGDRGTRSRGSRQATAAAGARRTEPERHGAMVARRARRTPRYDAAAGLSGRPFAFPPPGSPLPARRVHGPRRRTRGVMSTSPRKRPASGALIAGGVVILLIAIVGLVFWMRQPRRQRAVPAGRGHDPGPRDQRALRRSSSRSRSRSSSRRGPDRLEHPPLPPPAGRRRPPAPDARQQSRRGRSGRSSRPSSSCTCSRSPGTRSTTCDARQRRSRTSRSTRSRASSSGSSSTSTATARPLATQTPAPAPRAAAWPYRSAEGLRHASERRRDPCLVRAALPVQARRRARPGEPLRVHGRRGRGGPDLPRPVRRAVRHRPSDHALRRPRDDPAPTTTRGWRR